MERFKAWLRKVIEQMLGDFDQDHFDELVLTRRHSPLLERRRAMLITTRVRMVAAVFAIFTPLWIIIDLLVCDWPVWGWLAAMRIVATVAFAALALSFRGNDQIVRARLALALLLLIPALFVVASHLVLGHQGVTGVASVVATGYAFLPFVMVAGLAVFPVTALEGAAFATPLLAAHMIGALIGHNTFPMGTYIGAAWLLLLLVSVGTLAGMSQIHFMMALVRQSCQDVLTHTYVRSVGEELLGLQHASALRNGTPLSIIFFDLDHFKPLNDTWGHDAGDEALTSAGRILIEELRGSDMVIRWGGEEFLMVVPQTDCDGALRVAQRILQRGLGNRPDGKPLTASVGIAELHSDGCQQWQEVVAVADGRMYRAKEAGRNRICCCNEAFHHGVSESIAVA